jgi:hypothetical protein
MPLTGVRRFHVSAIGQQFALSDRPNLIKRSFVENIGRPSFTMVFSEFFDLISRLKNKVSRS